MYWMPPLSTICSQRINRTGPQQDRCHRTTASEVTKKPLLFQTNGWNQKLRKYWLLPNSRIASIEMPTVALSCHWLEEAEWRTTHLKNEPKALYETITITAKTAWALLSKHSKTFHSMNYSETLCSKIKARTQDSKTNNLRANNIKVHLSSKVTAS